ncbi:MAG TPA: GNAT family N-acetyltransferase [Polyangia bacterium]|nr:GNAT family N-acetyltransferase [Polyangia bacterium]
MIPLIRRIRPDDVALARALRLRALASDPSSFSSTYEAEIVREDSFWAHSAQNHAESRDCAIFLAFHDQDPVGLVRGGRDPSRPDIFFIHSMWVTREARRRGVARALLEAVETWIASRGGRECELAVTDAALAARRLYERSGYAADGPWEPSRRAGSKEQRMRKMLSQEPGTP